MANSFFRDDNTVALHGPEGLRPDFSTIAKAATGAGITELSLASLNVAGNRSERSQCVIRVTVSGSNPCFFSLGPASTAPGANTAMLTLLANSVNHFKATAQDQSAYHQQITGTSNIEICALV